MRDLLKALDGKVDSSHLMALWEENQLGTLKQDLVKALGSIFSLYHNVETNVLSFAFPSKIVYCQILEQSPVEDWQRQTDY